MTGRGAGRWSPMVKARLASSSARSRFAGVAIMQFEDGVALRQLIARLGHHHDPDGVIDRIFDAIAAGAEHHRRAADQFRIERRDISRRVRAHQMPIGRRRQPAIVVDDMRIAALRLDDPPEPIEAGARRDRPANQPFGDWPIGGDLAEHQHPGRQFDRHVDEIGRSLPFQNVDALDHFERIADRPPERRVHRRNQRFGFHARRVADRHERLGEPARIRLRLHEGAAAGLHVEHQRVDPFRDFLAHDRCADERDALNGAGDVSERVELLVGGSNLRGLADHGAADR